MTIPVTILTGFLGSGKTTLLNRILKDRKDERIAVIVNEFGDTSIDSHLIVTTEEDIIEINSGCICCNVRQDLIHLLQDIRNKAETFDRIIIETTGMADPAPVIQTFLMDESISETFEIDSVITMIDGKHIHKHFYEDEVKSQIAFADIIIINKTDIISDTVLTSLKETLAQMNTGADYFEAAHCNIESNQLMNQYTFNLNSVLEIAPALLEGHYHHHHNNQITSVVLKEERPLNMDKVNKWLSDLVTFNGEKLYRYKGILHVKETDNKVIFQGVHMTLAGMGGPLWKEDEHRTSEIVFIGKGLNPEVLENGMAYCLA